jgi:hypothetical protein
MLEEQKRLEDTLGGPAHLAGMVQNRGDMIRQLRQLKNQLDMQKPRAYEGAELDRAVKRELELREEITQGMPTQAEMRRNPTGVVDKLMRWNERNKFKVGEWKNMRLRLFESNALPNDIGPRDVANLERYRPRGGAQEMNMHGEQIEGAIIHLPDVIDGSVVVISDEDAALIKTFDADLFSKVALMSNSERARMMTFVKSLRASGGAPTKAEILTVDAEIASEGLGLADDDDDDDDDDDAEVVIIPADLSAMKWLDLQALAVGLGIKAHGVKKVKMIAAIEEKRNE